MSVFGHGVEVCTSTTRPTPTEGSLIYETDTNKLMLWNGTSWVTPMTNQSAGGDLSGTYPSPTISSVPHAAFPSGTIVQIQTRVTSASQSWNSYANNTTDCYCYITPRFNDSKIFAICTAAVFHDTQGSDTGYGGGIYSNIGGQIFPGSKIAHGYDGGGGGATNLAITHLASPNSTSNHYYQLTLMPYNNNSGTRVYLNRNYQGTDYSRMTLFEVRP